jgi:CelD/BcsL family acetyltransferase involved in cellulose biosynthesis
LTDPAWDDRVERLVGGGVFYRRAWLQTLHDTYGYRPLGFVSETDGTETGLLPVMEVDSWLTGRRGICLPFTDECAAAAVSPADSAALFAAAVEEGRQRRWKYLEVRGGLPPAPDAIVATAFYGHQLDLTGSEETLFNRLQPATRRAVRKAQQTGVTIERTVAPEAVDHLYRLMQRTRRRHGVPPQPRRFFRQIHRHLLRPGHGFILLARTGSRPIAAALFLECGPQALFKFGASDERFQDLRPNNLLFWEAIKTLASRGRQSLDLGRTSLSNEGLRRFKLSWGSHERTVNYFRYDCLNARWLSAADRSSGRHSAWFRHLPLPLSTLIGALLYRHIA